MFKHKKVNDLLISALPQIIGVISGLISSIIIAKELGAFSLGQYTLILSILTLACTLSDLGINQSTVKLASNAFANKNFILHHKILRSSFQLRFLLATVIITLLFLYIEFISADNKYDKTIIESLAIGLPTVYITVFSNNFTIYYQSLESHDLNSKIQIAQKIIILLSIVMSAYYFQITINNLIIINLLSGGLGVLIFYRKIPTSIVWQKFNAKGNSFKKKLTRKIIEIKFLFKKNNNDSFTLYYSLISIFSIITQQFETWFIALKLGPEALGSYNVATRFSLPINIIYVAIVTVFWPYAASFNNPIKLISIYRKYSPHLLIASIFLMAYSLVLPFICIFIFGNQYTSSIIPSQFLIIKASLSILHAIASIVAYNFSLVKKAMIITLFQLIIVTVFNNIYINDLGIVAMAASMLLSELLALILIVYAIIKKHQEILSK